MNAEGIVMAVKLHIRSGAASAQSILKLIGELESYRYKSVELYHDDDDDDDDDWKYYGWYVLSKHGNSYVAGPFDELDKAWRVSWAYIYLVYSPAYRRMATRNQEEAVAKVLMETE